MADGPVAPALRSGLVAVLLAVPVLVLRAHLWPLYPLAVLCGVAARAYGGRLLQLVLLIAAALLGPFLVHLAAPDGAADTATVVHDFGAAGAIEYVRQYVFAGAPWRAWVLLPCVALLGYAVADLGRFFLARSGLDLAPRTRFLGALAIGACGVLVAVPRGWQWLSDARSPWMLAERAGEADRRFLARVDAGLPTLDRAPLPSRGDVRVVLYLGESTSRSDWSLYGYPRSTNAPILAAADTSRLVTFTHAEAPAPSGGLPRAHGLSSLEFLYRRAGGRIVPLVHTLARARVGTVWLRNPSKPWRDDAALIGSSTAVVADARHDGDLVQRLRGALAAPGGSRLVVVDSYAGRYPWCGGVPAAERVRWDDWLAGLRDVAIWGTGTPHRAALDCYDATMRYASTTIADAMRAVDAAPGPTLLLFVADHGADAWGPAGPAAEARAPRVTDVPLLVYANDTMARRYPGVLAGARGNRDARVATVWVHDALLDAFGVAGSDGGSPFDPRLSILDPRFDPSADAPTLARLRLAPGDSARLARAERDESGGHLCTHRGDSMLKFLEGRAMYDCVEVDVVLDTSRRGDGPAFIYHPPAANPGLPLFELLARTGIPRLGLWLDMKNIDERNAFHFLARLSAVVPREMRGRVLVETSNDTLGRSAAGRAIADSGFVLSYYLPTDLGCACARSLAGDCAGRIASLERELRGGGFRGLSFDARGRSLARALRGRLSPRPVLNSWTPMDRCANGDAAAPLGNAERDSLLAEVQKYLVRVPSAFAY